MQRRVEKREQAQHAAQLDQPIPLREAPQGRDSQADTEKIQGPVTRAARDEFQRLHQLPRVRQPDHARERQQRQQKNQAFE